MKEKAVEKVENFIDLSMPIVKAAVNIPTLGFGGAVIEIFQTDYRLSKERNIKEFFESIDKKLKEIGIQIDETIKERLKSPEFYQIITRILTKIQIESRKEIREIYSNLLIQLLKEEPKINFNQKLFYLEILGNLNEDHIKILSVFYKEGEVKSRFRLDSLYEKTRCYETKKLKKGDPDFDFMGFKERKTLNYAKSSYFKGLVSDLVGKQIIDIFQEIESTPEYKEEGDVRKELKSIESEIKEEYEGTELGLSFYKFVLTYK
ncbi:hypothetical protein HYX02_06345 [Candidatus Woesearchaeota archaeon]|nr:hypothetical protein [Candidatus Woesearchaeota archaeon]